MSKFAKQVVVLSITCWALLGGAPARGGEGPTFFEGCGTLTRVPPGCTAFVADDENLNLLAIDGWEPFAEGDRIFVRGSLEKCGSPCPIHACLAESSIILPCASAIPTVSGWAALVLAMLFLCAATIVLRRQITQRVLGTLVMFCVLLLPGGWSEVCAETPEGRITELLRAPHHPEQLLVRFKPELKDAERMEAHLAAGGVVRKQYRLDRDLLVVTVVDGDLERTLLSYLTSPHVVRAEPDYEGYALALPDDEYFCAQWALQNNGGNVLACISESEEGTAGADIRATFAWDLWTGDADFRVAVVDTGVDLTHPDLVNNIWTNTGEIPGNDADDDLNGWIDDVHGYDFRGDGDPDPSDDSGHGTHVAGIIGATGNNAIGVSGINWATNVVALKIISETGIANVSAAIEAMEYIIANNIRLSNHSWGTTGFSQELYDKIDQSKSLGHIVVAAAANFAQNGDEWPVFPANFDLPNIISVAATDARDELASFSNYGAVSVDLAAPGYKSTAHVGISHFL